MTTLPDIKRINAHGHLVPTPEEIPAQLREEKVFWVDQDRKFMRQGEWSRPITDPAFFLDEKLKWMEKFHIDHEVILTLSQLYANGQNERTAVITTRFQNDFHASVQKRFPSKFTCGFVVPIAWQQSALDEIDRCVNELGLKVLCLPTHYQKNDGQWISTADRDLSPIFEKANDYGLAVQIHPYDGPKFIKLPDMFWRYHLIWMCAQTADHYHFYTLLDFPNKYPDIRTCYAHGNQFGQVNVGRRIRAYDGRPDLFKEAVDPVKNLAHENIFFDSIVHDYLSFELLVKRSGSKQIVAGLDNPYPLGEVDCGNSYPGKVIEEAVHMKLISEERRSEIWYDNVCRWLGFTPKFD